MVVEKNTIITIFVHDSKNKVASSCTAFVGVIRDTKVE